MTDGSGFESLLRREYEKGFNDKTVNLLERGKLPLSGTRGILIQFYQIVRNFPVYLKLAAERTQDTKLKSWLEANMETERDHAAAWVDMEKAFGIPENEIEGFYPIEQILTLDGFLMHVNMQRPIVEAVAATNFGVEGIAGDITKRIYYDDDGISTYRGSSGIKLDDRGLRWLKLHRDYDDKHPRQALGHILRLTTPEQQQGVITSLNKSLEYFFAAFDAAAKDR